jgi:cytochrome b subunit of formate dehydrogenase
MTGPGRQIQRFKPYQRLMHLVMFSCFLGLAVTGLPLHFSGSSWSSGVMRALGGYQPVGLLHRFFALGMLVVFALHLAELGWRLIVRREPGMLWGPSSMVPQPHDATQFVQHVRWFFHKGPRPRFGRFTYWEKFDYWAVFWGMLVIGGSGLLLWFPQAFATFLPGWIFNVALVVHGEEALLATAFIFTIHFFYREVSHGHGDVHRPGERRGPATRATRRIRRPAPERTSRRAQRAAGAVVGQLRRRRYRHRGGGDGVDAAGVHPARGVA